MGLQVNSSKCEIFPCGEEANNNLATFDSLLPGVKTLNENTFSLLGAPIFSAAIPSALEDKTRMIAQVREHLGHLSAHVALILFRACFSLPKLTYVIRTTPTWLFPEEVSVVDGAIRNTVESVINVTLDDNQWQQASLPIRYGGLGIRSIRAVSLPAFIASSNGVADLVADILKLQGERLSIPFQCDAVEAWAAACPGVDPPSKPESQRAWDDLSCKFSLSELSESLTEADVARIKAVTCPESGAWLQALPSPQLGTLLDNDTLRIAVALRLGCRVCEDHSCPCGASVDSTGHHGLSCAKCAGRFPRHHALNEIIRRALVSANVPCVLEPPGLCRTDGKRPDGLTLVPWDKGRSLLWDATCVSTFAASHLPKTTREAGSAAEFAAGQKHIKYAELERNYLFVPFAVETGGPWGREAKKFVRELGRRLRDRGCDPRSGAYLAQHISLAIQRGNAAGVMGTFEPDYALDMSTDGKDTACASEKVVNKESQDEVPDLCEDEICEKKRKKPTRKVSFPDEDQLVTQYFEPANPWQDVKYSKRASCYSDFSTVNSR
ncbi:hypothetical protein NE865_10088 [Phthorimaea operculella]|nr:hypothetical protein NE865_10088 [Phthorimaea operculella]